MPDAEHFRERLLKQGPSSLTEAELLATLIRTGDDDRSALQWARDFLNEAGGLQGLLANQSHPLYLHNFSPAKSATIRAVLEIARRLAKEQILDRPILDQPAAVAAYVSLNYLRPDQEIVGCLYLNAKNRLIADSEVYRGTITRTAIEPRAFLKAALLCSAARFVAFHGHPSGDPAPSLEDRRATRRLADAGELIGLHLIDHVIVGTGGAWVSMRRKGGW